MTYFTCVVHAALYLILTGCFGLAGTELAEFERSYKITADEGQSLSTDSLPIQIILEFNSNLEPSTFKESAIVNEGTAEILSLSVSTLEENRKYRITINNVKGSGTIALGLDISKVALKSGSLQGAEKRDRIVFNFGASNKLKALNVFETPDAAGSFKPLVTYKGRHYFVKSGISSVDSNFGSLINHATETIEGDVFGGFTGIIGQPRLVNKRMIFRMGFQIYAYDFQSQEAYRLTAGNSNVVALYDTWGCSGSKCKTYDRISSYVVMGNDILFSMDDGTDVSVYRSDGSKSPPVKIVSNVEATDEQTLKWLGVAGSYAYYGIDDGTLNGRYDIYYTDGVSGGVSGLLPGTAKATNIGFGEGETFVVGDRIYFPPSSSYQDTKMIEGLNAPVSRDAGSDVRLVTDQYVYSEEFRIAIDGSEHLQVMPNPSSATNYAVLEGKLLYTRGSDLYESDQTGPTSTKVNTVNVGYIGKFKDHIYVTLADPTIGTEIFKYSPSGGFELLKELVPGADGIASSVKFSTIYNDRMWFQVGTDIYSTDGTPAGTILHYEMPYWGTSWQTEPLGDGFLVAHSDEDHNKDLFYFDGINLNKVADLATGVGSLDTFIKDSMNGNFIFRVDDKEKGLDKYWFSNASETEMEYVGDITEFFSHGSKRYFVQLDETGNRYKIYQTNYTKAGTVEIVSDVGKDLSGNAAYISNQVGSFNKRKLDDYLVFKSKNDSSDNNALYCLNVNDNSITRIHSSSDSIFGIHIASTTEILYLQSVGGIGYYLYYSDCTQANTRRVTSVSYTQLDYYMLNGNDIYFANDDDIYKADKSTPDSEAIFLPLANNELNLRSGSDQRVRSMSIINSGNTLLFSGGWSNQMPYYMPLSGTNAFVLSEDLESGTEDDLDSSYGNRMEFDVFNESAVLISDSNNIWITEGAPSSTFKVGDACEDDFIDQAGERIFICFNGVYSSDGTSAGTSTLSTVVYWNGGIFTSNDQSKAFIHLGNFMGSVGGIYKLEAASLNQVIDFSAYGFTSASMKHYSESRDELYIYANISGEPNQIWVYKNSTGSFEKLFDLSSTNTTMSVGALKESNGKLLFYTSGGLLERMIWAYEL